jgi:hypothetical protein
MVRPSSPGPNSSTELGIDTVPAGNSTGTISAANSVSSLFQDNEQLPDPAEQDAASDPLRGDVSDVYAASESGIKVSVDGAVPDRLLTSETLC